MATSKQDMKSGTPVFYQIKVEGKIRESWSDWLNNMKIYAGEGNDQAQTTTLIGKVTDQPALRGILCKLWDLNLTIISICRLEKNAGEIEGKK